MGRRRKSGRREIRSQKGPPAAPGKMQAPWSSPAPGAFGTGTLPSLVGPTPTPMQLVPAPPALVTDANNPALAALQAAALGPVPISSIPSLQPGVTVPETRPSKLIRIPATPALTARRRPTKEEYNKIEEGIYQRRKGFTLPEVNTTLNWARTERLSKALYLGYGIDFAVREWDVVMLRELPEIIASQWLDIDEGRFYFDDCQWHRPPFTPVVAEQTGQDYSASLYATPYILPKAQLEALRAGRITRADLRPQKVIQAGAGLTGGRKHLGDLQVLVGSQLCWSFPRGGPQDPDELMRLTGCPYQAKGYTVVGGTRFVLRMQEQMRLNKILVYNGPELKVTRGAQNKKIVLQARMTYNTPNGSNVVYMYLDKTRSIEVHMYFMGRKYSASNQQVGEYMTLPLFLIFRLCEDNFNAETKIAQMLQLVPEEHRVAFRNALLPTKARSDGIENPVAYFVKGSGQALRADTGQRILAQEIDKNLFSFAASELSLPERLYMLLVMATQLILVEIGARPEDNRNHWDKKRIVTPGDHMIQLFRSLWVKMFSDIQADLFKNPMKAVSIVNNKFEPTKLTKKFRKCFSTGMWSADESRYVKDSVTMTQKIDNPASSWDEMKKLSSPTKEQTTNDSLRAVDLSQLPFVCPAQTPEGPKCGLVKALSKLTTVSLKTDHTPIRRFIRGEHAGTPSWLLPEMRDDAYLVSLNGMILGASTEELYRELLRMRRRGEIAMGVSISLNKFERFLNISTEGSRPIRPLLVLDEDQVLVIDKKNMWEPTSERWIDDLLNAGCLEFVDPEEQSLNCIVAMSVDDIQLAKAGQGRLRQQIDAMYQDLGTMRGQVEADAKIRPGLQLKAEQLRIYGLIRRIPEMERRIRELSALTSDDPETRYQARMELESLQEQLKRARRYRLPDPSVLQQVQEDELAISKQLSEIAEREKEYRELNVLVLERDFLYNKMYRTGEHGETILRARYTHVEPDPAGTLSVSSNLINRMNNDQGARGTFQNKMNTQAMGAFCNPGDMLEKTTKVLLSAQPPVVRTALHAALNLDRQPIGEMAIVAISSAGGGNQEDSIRINQKAYDLGKFMSCKYETVVKTLSKNDSKTSNNRDAYYEEFYQAINPVTGKAYEQLDPDGIPWIGAQIGSKDVIIGVRRIYYNDLDEKGQAKVKDMSVRTELGQSGTVDRVYRYQQGTNDETMTVKLYTIRRPTGGDKFALPHAQKFTMTDTVPMADMPFIQDGPMKGLQPDMILNMHSIPSRMATGMLEEMLMTTLGVELARNIDGSPFRPFNLDHVRRSMLQFGYHPYGLVNLVSGTTGQPIEAQIYAGSAYVLALKHQVEDKYQVASETSRRDVATGQMIRGRKFGSGMRFGEMENNGIMEHSTPYTLQDLFCYMADRAEVFVCFRCGALATPEMTPFVAGQRGSIRGLCRACGNDSAFARTTVTQVYVDIINNLAMANVRLFHKVSTEGPVGEFM